jgi:hypothetical protein
VVDVLPSEDEEEDEDLIPGTRGEIRAVESDDEVDYEASDAESSGSGSGSSSGSGSEDDSDSGESFAFEDGNVAATEAETPAEENGVSKKKKKQPGEDDEPIVTLPDDLDDTIHGEGKRKGRTSSVWKDESDAAIRVDIGASRLLRKLGRGKDEAHLSGIELEKKLREQ